DIVSSFLVTWMETFRCNERCQYPRTSASRFGRNAAFFARNPMDGLSDVLKSILLEGALYLNVEFTAPWCIRGKYGQASVRERLVGAEHVVFFHFLTEGGCKVRLNDSLEAPTV